MPCEGGCEYNTILQYQVDSSGNIVHFHWESNHSHSGDCRADIGRASGWFKFQRTGDSGTQRISADNITSSDPNTEGGTGTADSPQTFSGGDLPAGVTITRGPQQGEYHGIDISLPEGGTSFTSIDILLSFYYQCTCEGNTKRGEQIIRLSFSSSDSSENPVKHNGATRTTRAINTGTEVTYEWTNTDTCTETTEIPQFFTFAQAWERLCRDIDNGNLPEGLTEEQARQAKRELEEELKRQAGELTGEPVARLIPASPWSSSKPEIEIAGILKDIIHKFSRSSKV